MEEHDRNQQVKIHAQEWWLNVSSHTRFSTHKHNSMHHGHRGRKKKNYTIRPHRMQPQVLLIRAELLALTLYIRMVYITTDCHVSVDLLWIGWLEQNHCSTTSPCDTN